VGVDRAAPTIVMVPSGSAEVERFCGIVARRLGLSFDDTKLGFLADLLVRRAEARRLRSPAYLEQLEGGLSARDELRALAADLTVTETYFFRNPDQFRALREHALPSRLGARAIVRKVSVLTAGCASGEEAYSLAISLGDLLPDSSWALSIRAVDVNPTMLEKARRARYSAWSLRETPPEVQRRWFTRDGPEFVLDPSVRGAVTFEERNLVDDDSDLWAPGSYDVVFCRNVIMYLTPACAESVIRRIARALMPDGYLFLGHAETLRGLSQDFHLEHTHGTFYYRRRSETAPAEARDWPVPAAMAAGPPTPLPAPPASAALPALVEASDTWVEAIARAANRIRALSDAPPASRSAHPVPPAPGDRPAWNLGGSLELLRQERFTDALDLIGTLPPESARDPEVLLLRAVLLTHGGQLAPAAAVCAELLRIDELHSGAHYLLALCREGARDRPGAVEQNRIAVYLDPTFAMPRLHLGLLARRAGDHPAARLEFAQALLLLQREDASRLLLFGGGFGREALIALCRAELIACGGQP
jgi:chemotaxis protein methyltransferase CheR